MEREREAERTRTADPGCRDPLLPQDVSKDQMELIKHLVPPGSSDGCANITVCGDQDQSIYGFLDPKPGRVGRPRQNNFEDFRRTWPKVCGPDLCSETTFRGTDL